MNGLVLNTSHLTVTWGIKKVFKNKQKKYRFLVFKNLLNIFSQLTLSKQPQGQNS